MKNVLTFAAALALTGLFSHANAQTAKPMAKDMKMETKSEEKMEAAKEEKMETPQKERMENSKMRKHSGAMHHAKMAPKGKM
jgi:hypothetical protein